ncbi:type IV pilus twitching motility protein PilT [Microbacterium sp. Root61]|uniref:type IV pilus twitching motility protein PilT n=1 Tax=Microbacterium sp. Root61 TaxID=1736570 RepID=UPI0009E8AD73|nr:type IV pilus twitching motility protein PilT [Microbacterium sp. Root61]
MTEYAGIDRLLYDAARERASDIHLSAGEIPRIRVDGALEPMANVTEVLSAAWLESALLGIMAPHQRQMFEDDNEVDMSHEVAGVGRFRVNVFRQLGQIASAFRLIPEKVATLADLGVPAIARDLALRPRGLVLVTGPTGSGKSTTLTAMVDIINNELPSHIITIEDPIEYIHRSKVSLVHQREIGTDTASFSEALRRVLRQDPDVILIGELRDPESIAVALSAAETGQLVLATLHTQGAAKSINRIVDAFPAHQQDQVRSQLGDTLQGVISQTLLPLSQSDGRALASEVLVQTPAVANLIREGQVTQLYSAMQSGSAMGMHTMDQSLRGLVEDGRVAHQVAKNFLIDPQALDNVRVRPRDFDAAEWMAHNTDRAYAPRGV